MVRDIYIDGEAMVSVKGNSNTLIAAITQLGLSEQQIKVTLNSQHDDINVNAWGGKIPIDVQYMLSDVSISMDLIHFDKSILNICVQESMAGAAAFGLVGRAGARLGAGLARFAPGNHYVGLNIAGPISNLPWRFFFAYLQTSPMEFPLGVDRSVVRLNWRAIPYTVDPWNGGLGSTNAAIWDHGQDL